VDDWRSRATGHLRASGLTDWGVEFDLHAETLWQRLERVASQTPRGVALSDGLTTISYEGLLDRALALSATLCSEHGIVPGDRVALVMRNTIGYCLGVVACWALGAIAVSLSTRLTAVELKARLDDAEPRLTLAADDIVRVLGSTVGTVVAESAVLAAGLHRRSIVPTAGRYDDTAFILYTSGTTGRPKGVRISHRNALQAARTFEFCYGLTPEDRSVVGVPIFHGTGLFAQFVPMLAIGGAVVLLERFDPAAFAELASAQAVTHCVAVPTIYQRVLEAGRGRSGALPFRIIGVGGAPMPVVLYRALRRAFPRASVLNSYGLTEATSPALIMPPEAADGRVGSIGFATPTMEAVIVDPSNGAALPPGGVGELWLRGALISPGRWNDGEPLTTEDGWLATGDLAVADSDGFVTLVDRLKDIVNVGGEKVASVEVENVLAEHPAVRRVAVVAAPHADLGEIPVAYVVLAADATGDSADLAAWARERLAAYKVPRSFTYVTELPLNAAGKVLKSDLRARAAGRSAGDAARRRHASDEEAG
jgi:long-chain acyl-CoA synthetase